MTKRVRGKSRGTGDRSVWALAPHYHKLLPGNECLLIRADTGAVSAIASDFLSKLGVLEPFRTLLEHEQALLSSNPSLGSDAKSVRTLVRRLHQDGLLVSGNALVASMQQSSWPTTAELAPVNVAVLTCDRPAELARLLDSLLRNERRNCRRRTYHLVDDSRRRESVADNLALVNRHAGELDIRYHGHDERQAFLSELLREHPSDAEDLRWLVSADHPSHKGQATYGCPRNYLFLRFAGSRLLMLDDDAVVNVWTPPNMEESVGFDSIGLTRKIAPDFASLTAGFEPADLDPIGAHAQWLGLGLGEAIRQSGMGASARDLLGRATVQRAAIPNPATARIRYTLNALVGDPGTFSDIPMLYRDPDIVRSSVDDGLYKRILSQPRCVYNGRPSYVLMKGGHFLLATMAGLDLAPYMPPLMPAGRGEDTMLGQLVELLYPNDLGVAFPWALEHLPATPRPWRVAPQSLQDNLSSAAAFNCVATHELIGSLPKDPHDALLVLSRHILALADTELGRRRLSDTVSANVKLIWVNMYQQLVVAAQGNRAAGASWRADVASAASGLRKILGNKTLMPPDGMEHLLEQLRRYCAAISAWDRAWDLRSMRS